MDRDLVVKKILEGVPKVCMCGAPIKLSEDMMHLTCTNPNCQFKFYRKLERFAKAVGIENIGEKVALELVEATEISSFHELFELTKEDLARVPRFGDGMVNKIYNSIHSVKEVEFKNFVAALQIHRVGEGTAVKFARTFKSLDEMFAASSAKLAEVLEISSTQMTTEIKEDFVNVKDEAAELQKYLTVIYPETKNTEHKVVEGVVAVITGGLNGYTRKQFEEKYLEYGVKFSSSVSSNTTYLISNKDSESSKMKKAKAMGVKVMKQEDFENLFR